MLISILFVSRVKATRELLHTRLCTVRRKVPREASVMGAITLGNWHDLGVNSLEMQQCVVMLGCVVFY